MYSIRHIVFSLILLSVAFSTGCQTGYHASSLTGGYKDIETDLPFIFATNFGGNGYTDSTRSLELAKLRCAERAWRNGYMFFVEIAANTQINQTGTVSSGSAFPLYGGGSIAVGSSSPIYAPLSGASIMAFRNKPPQNQFKAGTEIYDTKDFITLMTDKYSVKVDLSVIDSTRPTADFENHLYKLLQNKDSIPIKEEIKDKDVLLIDSRSKKHQIPAVFQSGFYYIEFPYKNLEEAREFLTRSALMQNSNIVSINTNQFQGEQLLRKNISISFGIKVAGDLGVTLEPSLLKDKIFQIRNISVKGSNFKLGDKILSIDGKDTVNVAFNLRELFFDKKAGDMIKVNVARNGELVPLDVILTKTSFSK